MLSIRDDAPAKLSTALQYVNAIRRAGPSDIVAQHLNALERVLEQLKSSLIEPVNSESKG